jgi:hypothetical protein
MSEDYDRLYRRVKSFENAICVLKELALKNNLDVTGHDTSLTDLIAKLKAHADSRIPTQGSLERLTGTSAHRNPLLSALIDLVRKIHSDT